MVEVFVIHIESVNKGNKGYLSKMTKKTPDGIHVEFLHEIQDENPQADICVVVAYFTRSAAVRTKELMINEILHRYPDAEIIVDVESRQISLNDSRRLNQTTWSYK